MKPIRSERVNFMFAGVEPALSSVITDSSNTTGCH